MRVHLGIVPKKEAAKLDMQHDNQHATDRQGPDIKALEERAARAGLRLTKQRREVYEVLYGHRGHPSAEEVWRRVRQRAPSVSLDTVYRTLAVLEDLGLARRVPGCQDQARFDAVTVPHHHFVCRRCRAVYDVQWPEFDALAAPDQVRDLGRVEDGEVVFRGLCSRCAREEEQAER
jgi:Fur family peroxide stress response transcriptional regulator